MIEKTQYRDGRWERGSGDTAFVSVNPASGAEVARFRTAGERDVHAALDALAAAKPAAAHSSLSDRQSLLDGIARRLTEAADRIARRITVEMGKPALEATHEVETFIETCRWYRHNAGRAIGEVLPSRNGTDLIYTERRPVGTVLTISPWNYPIALAGYKIFAALSVGNCVLWKPAEEVTGTAILVAEAFERAGVCGQFALLGAAGGGLGAAAVADPRVDAIGFTGSTAVGIQIGRTAADRLVPCALELGGKNAAVVLSSADLDLAAREIVRCGFATTGQRCTATSRVIVVDSVSGELLERVRGLTRALRVGDGSDPRTEVGPLATAKQVAHVAEEVDRAVLQGAVLRQGGGVPVGGAANSCFFEPTVLDHVRPDMPIAHDEIFGPVLSFLRAADISSAIAIANDTDYGLATSIFARDVTEIHAAVRAIRSGLVYVNKGTTSAQLGVPFGGVGLSGNHHREVCSESIEFMTNLVSVYINPGGVAENGA